MMSSVDSVAGPLLNGATNIVFEGVPTHPTPARCWEIVEKYQVGVVWGWCERCGVMGQLGMVVCEVSGQWASGGRWCGPGASADHSLAYCLC